MPSRSKAMLEVEGETNGLSSPHKVTSICHSAITGLDALITWAIAGKVNKRCKNSGVVPNRTLIRELPRPPRTAGPLPFVSLWVLVHLWLVQCVEYPS